MFFYEEKVINSLILDYIWGCGLFRVFVNLKYNIKEYLCFIEMYLRSICIYICILN